jgi:RimJ/RimL family protein N-acetyltransferase
MRRLGPSFPTVRLRSAGPEDLAQFERWAGDAEVRRHYLGRGDRPAAERVHTGLPPGERARRGAVWLQAVETGGGELIGWIELRDISWRRRTGELRVCLGAKNLWGRGFGTAAVRGFVAQVFRRWGMNEIYLRVATWNRRAIRAYEKCGFRRTALLRAGRRSRDGLEDLLLMTLRRAEAEAGLLAAWEAAAAPARRADGGATQARRPSVRTVLGLLPGPGDSTLA